ncbi:MAG: 4'-phosphopantetheinyl transferase superfamily protein [Myxococcales bacterium]|nr:4'-phosphopantetheinyl transferase superfamily protein [Myxococcales bacterium]
MTSERLTRSEVLADLLGRKLEVWECIPSLHYVDELFPEERELITKAVDRRRAEFAAARVLARRAMGQLGVKPEPLLRYDDRAPRWPEGIVGTITHTKGYCAVALASANTIRSVGIDAELADPLGTDIINRICGESELRWLDTQPSEDRGRLAKLIFSAKEAFYKCQYPITQTFLGFRDVELEFDLANEEFRVAVLRKLTSPDSSVREARGRYRVSPELIQTTMIL